MTWLDTLGDTRRRLIFGNEQTTDPARAYDKKRAVHAGVKGNAVAADQTRSVWRDEMTTGLPRIEDACVYINIPFCQTKCSYCGFFKNLAAPENIAAYTDALLDDIEQARATALIEQTRIRAVYIGGGTPGTLTATQIGQLLTAVHQNLPLANDCEITFETRTHQFGDDKIQACIDHGVNRFSLGVQSFDTRSRRAIGRIDSGEAVMDMVSRLLALRQACVSLDFIFGLPHQTLETYLHDIDIADRLGVDGMALYQLNVFEGGRLDESIKSGQTIAVPETAEQYRYHEAALNQLSDMGYGQLSMSHWIRGTQDRSIYNRLSKAGCILHAFGAGAGGRTGRYRYFVHPSVTHYAGALGKGIKPIMGMTEKTPMAPLHDDINAQMDSGLLRFDNAATRFGIDLKETFAPLLDSWQQRGLATVGERTLRLLPAGQFWYINMTQALLDILEIITTKGAYEPPQERIAAQG